jgi:hypothetical protein
VIEQISLELRGKIAMASARQRGEKVEESEWMHGGDAEPPPTPPRDASSLAERRQISRDEAI